MFTVNNKVDLRLAWWAIKFWKELKPESAVEIKKNIRSYYKEQNEHKKYHLDKGDYDRYILLVTLPEWIETEDEAHEYFDACEYMKYYPSQYDCTGQHFTQWYRIFKRNGRWMAYHCICVDI